MHSLRDAEADLRTALLHVEPRTRYVEVMAERSRGLRVRLDKNATVPEATPHLAGAVFRAWDGNRWVETATTGLEGASLEKAALALRERLPSTLGERAPPGDAASHKADRSTRVGRPPSELPVDARVDYARTLHQWGLATPGIENVFVAVEDREDERFFLSSAGANIHQRITRVRGSVAPLALENGKVEYDFLVVGAAGGLEVLDELTQTNVTESARTALALLQAKSPPTGQMPVILDSGTTGTFAHESFGHGTEADQLLRDRSYLKPILGEVVGPESLTIVDDGAYPRGWGEIFFDDEGHPAQKTVLVDKGRFVEVLHDRESAAAMGRRPTGNTRRADFLSRPFVRMTNTYVEPRDFSLEELVQEAKDGVLLERATSGIEDPMGGNMQLKVKRGRRIVRGELGELLPSMALSGRVLDFLKAIKGVGRREYFTSDSGYCGKGHTDILPTGTGGSYLLSEAVVGPA